MILLRTCHSAVALVFTEIGTVGNRNLSECAVITGSLKRPSHLF